MRTLSTSTRLAPPSWAARQLRSSNGPSKRRDTNSAVKTRPRRCARATFKSNSDGERPMPNPPATESLDARILAAVQAARQPRPKQVRPIIVVGAGGIVRAAHLPAYEKAGFPVIGLVDQEGAKAAELASGRGIPHTFSSVTEAVRFAPPDATFDVAVPASQLVHILPQFPLGATVLMQKPMGETLQEARIIRDLCRNKGFIAAVNFSLRYSPNNLAVTSLANGGFLGEIHDIEVQTSTYTPWHLWTFLATAPRLEILYHSIHYFDLIRSWMGNPQSVFVATNHNHNFGPERQHSFVQWEGLRGAARITMGVNLDYPTGKPDTAEYGERGSNSPRWHSLPVGGNNFPDAFMGTMGALQSFAEGSASTLPSHFEDAFQTMALVEALYRSSVLPGVPLPLDELCATTLNRNAAIVLARLGFLTPAYVHGSDEEDKPSHLLCPGALRFLEIYKVELRETERVVAKANANGWMRQIEMNDQKGQLPMGST